MYDTIPPLRTYSRRQKRAKQAKRFDQVKNKELINTMQAEREEIMVGMEGVVP